jgi:hypothetical protein
MNNIKQNALDALEKTRAVWELTFLKNGSRMGYAHLKYQM